MGLFDIFKAKPEPPAPALAAPVAPAPEKTAAFFSPPVLKPGVQVSDLMRGIYDSKDAGENYSMELLALKGMYDKDYWIRRCVNIIAQAGSKKYETVPALDVEDIDQAKVERIEQFLNNLNDTDTFLSFIRKCLINLQVFGFFIAEIVDTTQIADQDLIRKAVEKAFNQMGPMPEMLEDLSAEVDDVVGNIDFNGIPFALRLLPCEEMEIYTDDHGSIIRYIQRPRNHPTAVTFLPNQVWHVVHPNATSGTYGESQIGCLSDIALIDRYIDIRQKNKLASDNSLDTLVTVENATQGVVEAIGRELQTKYGGPNGIRIFVGDQSIQINDISKTKDGDFLKEKELVRDSICLSLGVPLGILGVTDGVAGKGSGADEHQRNFTENTVRPLVQYLEAAFNRQILARFNNIGINYIIKLILEDTDDAMPLEQTYDIAVRNGTMTPNEKRGLMNLPKYEGYGDVALITTGSGATPLPMIENPPQPPNPPAVASGLAVNSSSDTEEKTSANKSASNTKKLNKATREAISALNELRKAM